MRRKLSTLAAALSALGFAAICLLWVGSYRSFARPYVIRPGSEFVSEPANPAAGWTDDRSRWATYYYSDRLYCSYGGYVSVGAINGSEQLPPRMPCVSPDVRRIASVWLFHQVPPRSLLESRQLPLPRRWGFVLKYDTETSGVRSAGEGPIHEFLPGLPRGHTVRYWCVGAPYWSLALVSAGLPLRWTWARIRRRHRRSANQCARCGYNLTGNLSGVCPECGTPAPARAVT